MIRRDWTQDEIDDDMDRFDDDECSEPGFTHEDCGRWSNGRLTQWCSKAGTEECDWECPYSR